MTKQDLPGPVSQSILPTDTAIGAVEGGRFNKTAALAAIRKGLLKVIRYGIVACLGGIALGIGAWLAIVIPELQKQGGAQATVKSAEDVARERLERIKEAERTATWQNAHCKLLHAYYVGEEPGLPQAELLGLNAEADKGQIQQRCETLLAPIHLLGGWPTGKPQQDNFVVCVGFRFELISGFAFSIKPTPESLAAGNVLYGVPGKETHSQKIYQEQAISIGGYTPLVVQADDKCVIVGIERVGRRRAIEGRILRATTG